MSDKGMMPRDSLGRMVYVGDTVEGLGVVDEADDGGFLFFKAFLGHLPVASSASYSAGCRCRRCRDANNAYHREYYRKVIAARRRDAERKVMERVGCL